MALFDSDGSTVSPPPEAGPALRRLPALVLLYSAVVATVLGVVIQVRNATVAIACRRDGGSLSCSLERRVLFDTLSIGTEHATGVRRARAVGRAGYRHRPERTTYAVVLDAADGEYEAGWSTTDAPAAALTNALNHRIETAAASFEETLPPDLLDGMTRLFGLLLMMLGAVLAVLAVMRWRQPAEAAAE